ncbi:hypothetical protein [Pedobacter sp. SL55]|uniref:hypothetical protein n=1 Tax=Pedobacter sp. SL55 TaxID=2995161 RepID=UPI00226F132B|nr:hypothetical protein [Pedobacter sp. SL55]WAC42587.1 hypothetical protein OVA16_09595 [Pedobacter sp. SL55]
MEDKISTVPVEPFSLIKQRKPVGDFIPDFKEGIDFLIAKIGDEQYSIKPADLASLIIDVSWMSSIPRWNAYISYYKEGRAVYTNAQYVLNIDPKKLDPKIFKKIKHNKEIIEDEAKYTARRKELEKFNEGRWSDRRRYFVEHHTNKYFLYFIVHIPLTLAELTALPSKLADYYRADGNKKSENNIKSRTINYNRCEYYFASADDNEKTIGGYNANNESQFLVPVKVYCRLTIDDCRAKFDAKAMQLFYGKPIDLYKGAEQKNEAYILEWFDY